MRFRIQSLLRSFKMEVLITLTVWALNSASTHRSVANSWVNSMPPEEIISRSKEKTAPKCEDMLSRSQEFTYGSARWSS